MNKVFPLLALWIVCGAIATRAQTNYEPYVVTSFVGNPPGYANGTGSAARFNTSADLAVDSAGNVYVADTENDTIRKITPAGVVTTFAGVANSVGSADGILSAARFNRPQDVAADSSNNLFVADGDNNTIRKITPVGMVTTIAGLAGNTGSANGTGSSARFNFPTGVAPDGAGNIYVADSLNHTIRKITSSGMVSTFAGLAGMSGIEDGSGSVARFDRPRRVLVNHAGDIIVADTFNNTIRLITPAAEVSTLAGAPDQFGFMDGPGMDARFSRPRGMAVDGADNIYVADTANNAIRQVAPDGTTSTLAGSGLVGHADGTGTAATFYMPLGLARANNGTLYIADGSNHTIRKITLANEVSTFAGLASPGSEDGVGADSRFFQPYNVAISSAGNLYIADALNNTIRKVSPAGVVTTLAGLPGETGSEDGTGSAARFSFPTGVAVDNAENVYVADSDNFTIRKITPARVVTTFAGLAGFSGSTDGTGNAARFGYPTGVTVDNANNIFVADNIEHTIRKITPARVVTTIAGLAGNAGSADGTGSTARFSSPQNVAANSAGNVYVTDFSNFTIRRITPAGVVTTIAGLAGNSGSADGTGSSARFGLPWGIAVDGAGNLYVTDEGNDTIRKITPAGVVTTLAGTPGIFGWNDGTGAAVRFNFLSGIAVNGAGRLYFTDTFNHVVRVAVPQLQLRSAVSRKLHNSAGTFDINLPLTGTPGVECRSSGANHRLVFTFDNSIASGNAGVTSGVGSPSGSPMFSGKTMTVELTGVADAQKITVTLSGVTDTFAQTLPSVAVSVNILAGDTNGNKLVNSIDVSQTKLQSGAPVSAANFREDVVVSGSINATDVSLVKSRSGFSVP